MNSSSPSPFSSPSSPLSFLPPNPLDVAEDPLTNELRVMREGLESTCEIWEKMSALCPTLTAVTDDYHCDVPVSYTFSEVRDLVSGLSLHLHSMGLTPGSKASLFAENSAHWLISDHAVQSLSASTAVRGADAPPEELRYIYEHSDSGLAILQGPKLLEKLAKDAEEKGLPGPAGLVSKDGKACGNIILIKRDKYTDQDLESLISSHPSLSSVSITFLSTLLTTPPPPPSIPVTPPNLSTLSTIVYTSGTTGSPKGVMLAHSNLLHQLSHRLSPTSPYSSTEPNPGETMLSLLPVWHITERTFELWQFTRGCKVVYSSIRTFKGDLAKHKPEWMVLVPRVLEKVALGVQAKFAAGSKAQKAIVSLAVKSASRRNSLKAIAEGLVDGTEKPSRVVRASARVRAAAWKPLAGLTDKLVWSKVRMGFGGNQKVIISGGSALSSSLEEFYANAGIPIVVGYGLTETSPLVSFRQMDRNLKVGGCVGFPCKDTEVKVVDEASREPVPRGSPGIVLARGPQVMRGYYKNEEATRKAIDGDGFFDTGDLGRICEATGDLILTGRAKDTIVLSNGENIEPQPLEDSILKSDLIDQIVLSGDDGRRLVAICVLSIPGLVARGFMTQEQEKLYSPLVDKLNDPQYDPEACADAARELRALTDALRSDSVLTAAVQDDLRSGTGVKGGFRAWESVSEAILLTEPFAMSNGLLTQSFKVKRQPVVDRWGCNQ